MVSCHPDRFSSYYPTAAEPEFVPMEASITPDDQILVDELRRRGHQVAAAEAPVLQQLADRGVPIDGVAIRDRPADLERFLTRYGNPYQRIGADNDSFTPSMNLL